MLFKNSDDNDKSKNLHPGSGYVIVRLSNFLRQVKKFNQRISVCNLCMNFILIIFIFLSDFFSSCLKNIVIFDKKHPDHENSKIIVIFAMWISIFTDLFFHAIY